MSLPEESALVVVVSEAESLVGSFRAHFDRAAARGLPAHITLLYPFRHPDRISQNLIAELDRCFHETAPFSFRLSGICGFPGVVYLAPEPVEPFDGLTRRLAAQYPDMPPYGGAFSHPVPHLTVAHPSEQADLIAVTDSVLAQLGGELPIRCTATCATLFLKRRGRWSGLRDFPFGGPRESAT